MRTANGGRAAVGMSLDYLSTSRSERVSILEREAALKEWRKTLPKRRKPDHEKPGAVTWIQLS